MRVSLWSFLALGVLAQEEQVLKENNGIAEPTIESEESATEFQPNEDVEPDSPTETQKSDDTKEKVFLVDNEYTQQELMDFHASGKFPAASLALGK